MTPTTILLLKLVVTPAIVLAASLAGRVWGQSIGGWLVALPLTSGPIAFFLALDQGPAFVQEAAYGVVSGGSSQGAFAVVYARTLSRGNWPLSLMLGLAAYTMNVTVLRALGLPFLGLVVAGIVCLLVSIWLMPKRPLVAHAAFVHPPWDLPARMLIATALVVGLTAAATLTGPWLNGVLATVPVFVSVMTVFAQRHYGVDAALNVLWGFALGVFSVIGFFVALRFCIVPTGIATSFFLATLMAFVMQGVTLLLMPKAKAF